MPHMQHSLTKALAFFSAIVCVLLTVALSTPIDPAIKNFPAGGFSQITSWYKERIDAVDPSGKDLSGAVIAIAKEGKLAYLQPIGFQDRAKTIPMTTDSIFWIASMTKPITSVAAMTLVDDGKLDLDAPVAKYLPELKTMQVATAKPNPASGKIDIALEPPKRPRTVRDLLRHTSGLVYPPQFLDEPINRLYAKAAFEPDNSLAEFVTSLSSLPLAHQPGEVWEYSWGVDVLARVVEVASGQQFDRFLQSRVFKPLGMVDTGFYVPSENLGRVVEAPTTRPPQFDITWPRKLVSGGGGLASTALDYLRFCQMLLNGGELDGVRILAPETVKLMTADALPYDVSFVGRSVGPDYGTTFGLGFAIRTSRTSSLSSPGGSVGSFGWSGVWGTDFWVDPAQKVIAVQMIQVAPEKVSDYFTAMRNLTYGALNISQH
jgi:CubicO group peptidase (beta-lactamase class C family)